MMYHRRLSRDSAHRRAMLRNMIDSLFEHESIQTTWPKAKEVQRMADKLITLGKRNTERTRQLAHAYFYVPKLFGPIRERYADRQGGYTRVVRVASSKPNQAPMAVLELVDGPHDIRFAMAARAIALARLDDKPLTKPVARSIEKMGRQRPGLDAELDRVAAEMTRLEIGLRDEHDRVLADRDRAIPAAGKITAPEKSTLERIREKVGYVPEDIVDKMSI